jgi:hypothetical protein
VYSAARWPRACGDVIGANAAAKSLPKYDIGVIGNSTVGAIGGVVCGEIIQVVIAFRGLESGIGSIIGPLAGGCARGAISTIVVDIVIGTWKETSREPLRCIATA